MRVEQVLWSQNASLQSLGYFVNGFAFELLKLGALFQDFKVYLLQ
jgi:hypothetical protein